MTEHLPECLVSDSDEGSECFMCIALARCEVRVREDWYETQSETWVQGYMQGLAAAREAVDSVKPYYDRRIDVDFALAAIDALRDEK